MALGRARARAIKGGGRGKFLRKSWKCGKPGHKGADCRSGCGQGGGGQGGGKSKGKGKGKCFVCGGDHFARKCPERHGGARSLEEEGAQNAASSGGGTRAVQEPQGEDNLGGLFVTALDQWIGPPELLAATEVLRARGSRPRAGGHWD